MYDATHRLQTNVNEWSVANAGDFAFYLGAPPFSFRGETEAGLLRDAAAVQQSRTSVSHMLAEHVWEHLTLWEALQALINCGRYLVPGGRLRLAVPDYWRMATWHGQQSTKSGASLPGDQGTAAALLALSASFGHHVEYTIRLMCRMLLFAGLQMEPLEFHDVTGLFHFKEWDIADGFVTRSLRYDKRGAVSLIVDAYRPLSPVLLTAGSCAAY